MWRWRRSCGDGGGRVGMASGMGMARASDNCARMAPTQFRSCRTFAARRASWPVAGGGGSVTAGAGYSMTSARQHRRRWAHRPLAHLRTKLTTPYLIPPPRCDPWVPGRCVWVRRFPSRRGLSLSTKRVMSLRTKIVMFLVDRVHSITGTGKNKIGTWGVGALASPSRRPRWPRTCGTS